MNASTTEIDCLYWVFESSPGVGRSVTKSRSQSEINEAIVDQLLLEGLITQFQAEFLRRPGTQIDDDTFAHPYLRSIPEFTRGILGGS